MSGWICPGGMLGEIWPSHRRGRLIAAASWRELDVETRDARSETRAVAYKTGLIAGSLALIEGVFRTRIMVCGRPYVSM